MSSAPTSRAVERPTFTLLGDQPEFGEDDPLGFDRVASELAALIMASRDRTPFTVGIKGDWGSGKSSLMRRLERTLAKHEEEVVSVWFNAWTSERGDTLEGLIKSVLEELDSSKLRKLARNKSLITGLRVVTTVAAGPLRIGNVVDALWERASVDPQARNDLRDVLVQAMEDWIAKTPEGVGNRVLAVFVDDLDRCSPDTVFQVFEAIKLYLDARGFVFVIGFDESVVSDAILEQKKFSKAITSQLFLDKIVQIEYSLPSPDENAVRAFLNRLTTGSGTARLVDESARSLIAQGSDRNPRRLKRFINAFVLEHTLDPEAAQLDPDTLIRELILRTFFQEFVRLSAGGGDPLSEFLEYFGVREALLANGDRTTADEQEIRAFFASHRTPPGELDPPALAALEQNLPEPYPRLAENANFVSLVRYLLDHERDKVRSRLEKAADTTTPGGAFSDVAAELSGIGLSGMRVLWTDDQPDANQPIIEMIRAAGAAVVPVLSGEAAAKLLEAGESFDLLVSDITRDGDEDAGFADLARFRSDLGYEGPAVFFTSRITPARRERARALRASVTDDPVDVIRRLRALSSGGASKPSSKPSSAPARLA